MSLYTTRKYPCGCQAEGPGDVPVYCSEHGMPPELEDPIKVMERGRFLSSYVDDARRYRWLKSHIAVTIIQRINPKALDMRMEALDAVIDLKRERAASAQAESPK